MKIAVISANKQHMESILHILQEEGLLRTVLSFEGGEEQLGPVADRELPDLIAIESAGDGREAIAALESVSQRHPAMSFIMLCERVSAENLTQAMRVGVREVLPTPVSPQALREAVARVEQKLVRAEKHQHKGKVLAFIACKGGSGATFLAANLGYVLAAEHDKRVVLIDLNLQFGDASLYISDHVPATTLADLSHEILRLDASFLASSLVQVLPNFGVLAAPDNPDRAADSPPVTRLPNRSFWPTLRSRTCCSADCVAVSSEAINAPRCGPNPSRAPARIKASIVRRLTLRASTRRHRSKISLKGPP